MTPTYQQLMSKGKVAYVQPIKAYRGSRRTSPRIPNPSIRYV